jgi:two-component system chemotaxis sensor kinase CheA
MALEFIIFCIIALMVFAAIKLHPDWGFIIFGFMVVAGLAGYIIVRAKRRAEHYIRRATIEITKLTDEKTDKKTDAYPEALKPFMTELEQVKIHIGKKGFMRQEFLAIANIVASYMEIEKLLHDLLPKLNNITHSTCSAFYGVNHSTNKLELRYSTGFSGNIYKEFDLTLSEGLIGVAAASKNITLYRDIPEDTVYVTRTVLGKIMPRSLMVVPIIAQEQTAGVLVCASIYDYTQDDQDMLELIRNYIGVAVINGANYEKTKRLANELVFQNKLIQEQYEDMKRKLNEKSQQLEEMSKKISPAE